MKKICFITTVHGTLLSFVLDLAKYLYETGEFEIWFVCNTNDEFKKMLPDYIHYYPVNMRRGINLDGVKAIRELKKLFKKEKFDLVQYSTPNASLYTSIAAKQAKVPVRLYCQWGILYVGFTGIKRKIFKLEEKLVCRLSTWIEPDSYSNLNFAIEQGLYPRSKGSVIWNGSACGVDLKKFDIRKKSCYRTNIREKYRIPSEAFVFGFVGRVTRDKGINEILEAFKGLNDNCYLMMVGPNEVDATIDQHLYDWSIKSDRVIYTGYTNFVEQYLSAMDCYVLPSYREGFGMGVVEAEAMGLPVIVSDIPGPVDAMEDHRTGIVIPTKNVRALYSSMCWIMENPIIARQYAQNGVAYVQEKFERNKLQKYILNDRIRLLNGQ